MMNLKKFLALMLAMACMLSVSPSASALTAKDFSDVKETDWFFPNVDVLVQLHMIDGYSNGSFRPYNTITVAEYIKTLVSFKDKQAPAPQGHWAANYMAQAEQYALIDAGEYAQDSWDKPITRQQMINIAYRYVIDLCGESPDPVGGAEGIDTREYFIGKIADWDSIPSECQEYVLVTYMKGITAGYVDGTFRGESTATRAEACAIILRTISESARIPFSIDADAMK